ncbi:MAG: hypothetical protein IJ222_06270 [Bacteroidales bacterium]|nr:hypothetical protein [Bacteroidales bacterium]
MKKALQDKNEAGNHRFQVGYYVVDKQPVSTRPYRAWDESDFNAFMSSYDRSYMDVN